MAQNSSAIAAAVAQSDRGGLASIGRRGGTRPRSAGQTDMFSMLGLAPAPAQVGASAMPVPEPEPAAPPAPPPPATAIAAVMASPDFRLRGERKLAADWKSRARDNVDAIQLSAEIEAEGRPATEEEQARLSLFTGFGASDLATSVFRDAATKEFRAGWESLGQMVETAVRPDEMDSLARSIQFAHYTPEVIVEAMWSAVTRLGFAGGRVLDAGFGTGMFKAMQPEALDGATRYTGVEADVVTARIARLLHPGADVFRDEFENVGLRRHYNLAIGNPPYANLVVRKDADYRSLSLMLHDYFIVKSLDALRPGGLAAFVTSRGTMDKGNASARARMAEVADLVAAFRLPDGAFQAKAGTDAGTDVLIFRRRLEGEAPSGPAWLHTVEWNGARTAYGHELVDVNEYWPSHREHVLGQARAGRSRFGKNVVRVEAHRHEDLAASLARVVADLPEGLVALSCAPDDLEPERREVARGKAADGFTIREGSYFVETATDRLMQVVDGREVAVPLKSKASPGMASTHARIVRALVGVRDLVREILRLQDAGDDSSEAQRQLGLAYDAFAKAHGPINRTVCHVTRVPGEDGAEEERRSYRYPNLSPFRDDPDVWLVASIERYDAETDTAERSAIFTGIVVRPPGEARITSASDALAVTLSTKGRVDVAHIASLLGTDTASVRDALAGELFLDPVTGDLQTADQYLSGAVRLKLEQARRHAAADPSFDVNVAALERVQPADLPPSDITAQLGAPWIPGSVVEDFAREVMGATTVGVTHAASVGTWVVSSWFLESDYAARIRWGGGGRSALNTISDALNNVSPQVTMRGPDGKSEVVDPVATEQARAKIQEAKEAFTDWVWTDPDRTDDLVLRYNTIHNDTVPRTFDGSHMTIEGASPAFAFYDKQKTAVWRIVSAGSTYVAHAVGAGKTATIAAAIMEQRRLGLVNKALLTVPGHCLAQVAGQFLALYPKAKILVADEQNFARENRRRFLARAATGHWDCIVITHSALKFIPVPTDFEEKFLSREIARYIEALGVIRNSRDRGATRRLEAAKQRLEQRLAALTTEKDDFLSLVDIGVDQIVVDEAHEFRKLSFNTQNNFLKGVDPNGSMMSWDLFTKAGCLREIRADAGRGRRDFVDPRARDGVGDAADQHRGRDVHRAAVHGHGGAGASPGSQLRRLVGDLRDLQDGPRAPALGALQARDALRGSS